MIKLRTVMPIAALSLASLGLTTSCVKSNGNEKQTTELVTMANQNQAVDKFEKSKPQEEKKKEEPSPWAIVGFLAIAAGAIAAVWYDGKKMMEDPEYAETYFRIHGEYFPKDN